MFKVGMGRARQWFLVSFARRILQLVNENERLRLLPSVAARILDSIWRSNDVSLVTILSIRRK